MTTAELVSNVYLVATGKLPTFLSGSTKWLKIVAIANNKIDTWQNEDNADWNSLYSPNYALGNVTNTDTYDLDDDIRQVSNVAGDTIVITHIDGNTTEYETVDATDLKQHTTGNYCAQVGQTLVFNHLFVSTDPQYGGSIAIPVFLFANHLQADTDTVPVDDPQWLVLTVSAEYVRNDIVKQNQYPSLVNEANALMNGMKSANEAQVKTLDRPWRPLAQNW